MNLFIIDDAADGNQTWVYSAVAADGVPVARHDPHSRIQIVTATAERAKQRRWTDKLFPMSRDLLISARACTLFRSLRIDDCTRFIPTGVHARGGRKLADYFLVVASTKYDVLDRAQSELRPSEITGVKRYVFARERLPPLDLFLTTGDDWDWVATSELVSLLERAGMTGFRFTPANVV